MADGSRAANGVWCLANGEFSFKSLSVPQNFLLPFSLLTKMSYWQETGHIHSEMLAEF